MKVPIRVDVGYPDHLKKFEIPKEFELAALLSQIRPSLKALMESAEDVTGFIVACQDDPQILEYCDGHICHAGAEAKALLAIADQYDLAKALLGISSDILGCYTYTSLRVKSLFPGNEPAGSSSISLFWGCIGIIAKILGVEIQELTAVVLAHELAHAYTHLGYDIDGNRWHDDSWQHSDLGVVEGLAQYYTERVLLRLSSKVPGGYRAIVSGPLDADKQDYLLRDSYFCGVKYGVFDLGQLHRELRAVKDEIEGKYLMISQDGVHALEQFVLAKYYIANQVYRHRVRLITDQMLIRAISLGIEHDDIVPLRNLYTYRSEPEYLKEYLRWDDATFMVTLTDPKFEGTKCHDLLTRLKNRNLFKRIYQKQIKELPEKSRLSLSGISKPANKELRTRLEAFLWEPICKLVSEKCNHVILSCLHMAHLITALQAGQRFKKLSISYRS